MLDFSRQISTDSTHFRSCMQFQKQMKL